MRPQFSLKTILWVMVGTAAVFGSAHYGIRSWRRMKRLATYPVTGRITIDGREPAVGWQVTFAYDGSDWLGEMATGTTDERGDFLLETPSLKVRGASPGNYLVGLSPPPGARTHGLEQYADPITSGVKAVIKPEANAFQFDLRAP